MFRKLGLEPKALPLRRGSMVWQLYASDKNFKRRHWMIGAN
jgi:hypothetical protein